MRRAMAPWPPTYSDMSMRTIELLLVAEEPLGEGLGELRLADARGAEEEERAGRLPGVAEPRPRPQHRVRDGADRLVLPDDALAQPLRQVQQPPALVLPHPRHRDARPFAHHLHVRTAHACVWVCRST